LESKIKKRINAVIAIIKDIEKNHDKPTTAMLQSLFMEFEPKEKKIILEKEVKENKVQFVEKTDTNTQL
ncbi:BfmA/BtgA family mobilization protein, partial [Algibacter miyuki]